MEFIAVFVLGFLAAAGIAAAAAPVLQRRIARLAEERIRGKAALGGPGSAVRSDVARARLAGETARLAAELRRERDERTRERVTNAHMQRDLATLADQKRQADRAIAELTAQSEALRSEARRKQDAIETLTLSLSDLERGKQADMREIERLNDDLITISTELESMKIDLAANGTEAVSLSTQLDALKAENRRLNDDIKTIADTAREFEEACLLEQERHNNTRIDLAASQSLLSSAEMERDGVDHRIAALQRERDDLANARKREAEAHEATRTELAAAQSGLAANEDTLRQAGAAMAEQTRRMRELTDADRQNRKALKQAQRKIDGLTGKLDEARAAIAENKSSAGTAPPNGRTGRPAAANRKGRKRPMPSDDTPNKRTDDLQSRQKALIDALKTPGHPDDARLREELADIAAMVIGLSAATEGKASPIGALLAEGAPENAHRGERKSLAVRAREEILRQAR